MNAGTQERLVQQDERGGFAPLLLKVEVSADLLNPGDDLWVTSWWQNVGTSPARRHLSGFMELEFGHQRIPETRDRYYRVYWEPYPGPHYWNAGEICATTCRWHVPPIWGGTYKLYLGFCDDEHVPIDIYGPENRLVKRVYIGEIEIGWGWGIPTVELTRKVWTVEFNKPYACHGPDPVPGQPDTVKIGKEISVTLASDRPVLLGLSDKEVAFVFPALAPEVLLRERRNDRLIYGYEPESPVSYKLVVKDEDRAIYEGMAFHRGDLAARWRTCFIVEKRKLTITLEDIQDGSGYELLEVRMPALVSASGDDVRIVDFYGGGRLIAPDKTRPLGYVHHYDVRNVAAIYNSRGTIILESQRLDDRIYVGVQENSRGKRAALGIALMSKVRARGDMASVETLTQPQVTVNLLDTSWGAPSWQTVARFLRQGLTGKIPDFYKRAVFAKYHVTQGPQPEPWQVKEESPYGVTRLTEVHTFAEVLETIRRIHNLIGEGPQVVYIAGWQYRGFDTGYPYVFETDPRVGTIQDLRHCIQEGRCYNALVGMHDNYDDCYPSPFLDPCIIAKDANGGPWKGWIWAGGLSYIVGLPKYVGWGLMQERVRRTIELYGINTTYHLDVLSSEPLRYDFDPAWPAAADASHRAKAAIIEEFNKYGIDITSETLTHPFVGLIGYAWSTRDNPDDILFPGEKYIPLTSMVYHGLIRYDIGGESEKGILLGIICGGGARWGAGENRAMEAQYTKAYYLQTLPMGLLCDRVIEDYQEEGPAVLVSYGDNSYVRVDMEKRTYEIVVDGHVVARDWTTFAPGFKEGDYLAYALHGGTLRYPLPEAWPNGTRLRAVMLTAEGEGREVPCKVKEGMVELEMPAGVPVRINPVAD